MGTLKDYTTAWRYLMKNKQIYLKMWLGHCWSMSRYELWDPPRNHIDFFINFDSDT